MAANIRVTRDDDFVAQQKIYKASGVDKHGRYHDYSATTEEEAVQGCRDEIDEADAEDDE
jgi:hypothetical protein